MLDNKIQFCASKCVRLLPFLAALGFSFSGAVACPTMPPVERVSATSFYTDQAGSIPDPILFAESRTKTKKIDEFLSYIERALDADPNSLNKEAINCARGLFQQWAAAGALVQKPIETEGIIQRALYISGLNIIELKFIYRGIPIDHTILEWLRNLNHQVIETYANNDTRTNLYNWTGAAAALFSILDRDRVALAYENQVWRNALGYIRSDGSLDREMARGQMALVYHIGAFDGLVILRAARKALGEQTTAVEALQLEKLANFIARASCHPETLNHAAHAVVETPPEWGYRVPSVFAQDLLNADWHQCSKAITSLVDVRAGGNLRISFDAIISAAKHNF